MKSAALAEWHTPPRTRLTETYTYLNLNNRNKKTTCYRVFANGIPKQYRYFTKCTHTGSLVLGSDGECHSASAALLTHRLGADNEKTFQNETATSSPLLRKNETTNV